MRAGTLPQPKRIIIHDRAALHTKTVALEKQFPSRASSFISKWPITSHLTIGRQYSAPIDLFHQFTSVLSEFWYSWILHKVRSVCPSSLVPRCIFSRLETPSTLGYHHASTWHWKVLISSFLLHRFSPCLQAFEIATTNTISISIMQSPNIWFLFQKPSSQNLLILRTTLTKWYHKSSQQKHKKHISSSFFPECFSCIRFPCPFISASVLTKAGVAGVCLEGCFRCCIQPWISSWKSQLFWSGKGMLCGCAPRLQLWQIKSHSWCFEHNVSKV